MVGARKFCFLAGKSARKAIDLKAIDLKAIDLKAIARKAIARKAIARKAIARKAIARKAIDRQRAPPGSGMSLLCQSISKMHIFEATWRNKYTFFGQGSAQQPRSLICAHPRWKAVGI